MHLLHDPTPMDLQRDFADPKLRGRLFVEQAGDDKRIDLSLARRQLREAALQRVQLLPLIAYTTVQLECSVDGSSQRVLRKRLG